MARAAIAGSALNHAGYRRLDAADPATPVRATIVLRGDNPAAVAASLKAVESFAREHSLKILEANPETRSVALKGSASQMNEAFGANFAWFETLPAASFEARDSRRHLSYEGDLTVPEEIAPHVIAVLGLDQRPAAKTR